MKLQIWIYFFKHAFLSIMNNRLINLISMGTISISLLLFGSFMLLSVNLNNWIREWGESLSMSVYIEDSINKMTKRSIESRLSHLPGAEMKRFISKEQAMVHLKEALGAQAGLLGGLDINPLPASYEIVIKDVKDYQIDPKKLKESLEKLEGVEEVQYTEQWVERFEGLIYILKLVGLIIGGFLCIAVLFITTNTIKLNIYSRRDEIEIYKLVGATDWFVKIPFLIEGAIQGILSGLFSLLVLFFVYSFFSAKTVHFFQLPTLGIIFLPNEYSVFLISLSLILGLSGAFIAIGRFFKL